MAINAMRVFVSAATLTSEQQDIGMRATFLTSRGFVVVLVMLALVSFAFLPIAFMARPDTGTGDWWWVPAVAGLAAAVLSARTFRGQPFVAAVLAGVSTALIAWGEIAMMVALRNTMVPYGWWNEDMIGSAVVVAPPLAICSAIACFLMARSSRE